MPSQSLSGNSAFAQQIRAQALKTINEHCQPIAADAVVRCDRIVAQLYDNERSGYRSKGGTPLLGSFSGQVIQSGDSPVRISLRSSLQDSDPAKLWSLENGSVEHDITGSPNLVFERSAANVFTQGPKKRSKVVQNSVGGLVRTGTVHHPGTKGGRFMQQALASAIQARLRLARGLTLGGR